MLSPQHPVARLLAVSVALKLCAAGILCLHFAKTELKPGELGFLFVPEGTSRAERIREIKSSLVHRLTPYDGQWYLDIAHRGYRRFTDDERAGGRIAPGNYAFFPLLPALLRVCGRLVPGNPAAAGLAIVFGAGCAGLVLTGILAKDLRIEATLTAVLLAAFPTAVFQLALYTEAIFLLLSTSTLIFALRRKPLCAASSAFLCGLARPQGILLAIPLALEFLPLLFREPRRLSFRAATIALACLAPAAGFLAMGAVSLDVAGSPGAFLSIQGAWRRSFQVADLIRAFEDLPGYSGPPMDALALPIALLLLPFAWARLPRSIAAYGTALVVFPLLTGSLLSFGRFLSVSVPHFLALATILRGNALARDATLLAFAVSQVLLGKGLIAWYFVG